MFSMQGAEHCAILQISGLGFHGVQAVAADARAQSSRDSMPRALAKGLGRGAVNRTSVAIGWVCWGHERNMRSMALLIASVVIVASRHSMRRIPLCPPSTAISAASGGQRTLPGRSRVGCPSFSDVEPAGVPELPLRASTQGVGLAAGVAIAAFVAIVLSGAPCCQQRAYRARAGSVMVVGVASWRASGPWNARAVVGQCDLGFVVGKRNIFVGSNLRSPPGSTIVMDDTCFSLRWWVRSRVWAQPAGEHLSV